MVVTIKNWIEKLVWGNLLQAYGIVGRIVTGVLQNAYAVIRDIASGQLTLRAMSLVYTTLLSTVPLIAVSFSVLKGFGVHKDLEQYLYRVLEPLGDKGIEIIDQVMNLVNNVNGSVLGGIGLAFFIYTAISMVQKIEESFNYVWYVSKPRSFSRRFTEYLLVLLIVPLAIVIALGAIASLGNESVFQWLAANTILGPVFSATTQLTPYFVVIVDIRGVHSQFRP
jgi:membrane protein